MRRDDAKRLIRALMVRRYNDAVRIMQIKKKLNDVVNDDDDGGFNEMYRNRVNDIIKLVNRGAGQIYSLRTRSNYATKPMDNHPALKLAEVTANHVEKALFSKNIKRAKIMLDQVIRRLTYNEFSDDRVVQKTKAIFKTALDKLIELDKFINPLHYYM